MKQQITKKLMLNKETIRLLTDNELTGVAGGLRAYGTNTCNTCLKTGPCTNQSVGNCTSNRATECGQQSCNSCYFICDVVSIPATACA